MDKKVNEKKKKYAIVITFLVLMICITGGTYAYFALTASNNSVTGSVGGASLNLEVTKVYPTSEHNNKNMIPQLESTLDEAISIDHKCVDGNGNVICQVYSATVTNVGSTTSVLNGMISFTGIENMPNLKWMRINDSNTLGTYASSLASTDKALFEEERSFGANTSNTYYFVFWIDETGEVQTDNGTFRANIEFDSSTGGLTSTIRPTELEPGLYKADGTFISWSQLTSKEYQSFDVLNSEGEWETVAILNVDANGTLTGAYDLSESYNRGTDYLSGELVIPEGITAIGDNAFFGNYNLTSVIIPTSVTSIGDSAFAWCESLVSIDIKGDLTSIGELAFDATPWYNTLSEGNDFVVINGILVPSGYECNENSIIPNNVKTLAKFSFSGCSSESVYYDGTLSEWEAITKEEGWAEGSSIKYINCSDGTIEVTPKEAGVLVINGDKFYSWEQLISDGIIEVWNGTLNKLEDANYIAQYFGANIDYFTRIEIIIPNNITGIGAYALDFGDEYTLGIENVIIPKSVTSLQEYSLNGASNVAYDGTISEWNALVATSTTSWISGSSINVTCSDGTTTYNPY